MKKYYYYFIGGPYNNIAKELIIKGYDIFETHFYSWANHKVISAKYRLLFSFNTEKDNKGTHYIYQYISQEE